VEHHRRGQSGIGKQRPGSRIQDPAGQRWHPGIFPAQGISQSLYVDGALTGNILYGGRTREDQTLAALWQAKHSGVRMPPLRFWIIFNNQFRFPPQVTQERWPDIMNRAMIMATQTSTVSAMRHLYAKAEIAHLKHSADVQVRVIAGTVYGDVSPQAWKRIYDANKAVIGADPSQLRMGMRLTIPES
jgi:hypothetical protein